MTLTLELEKITRLPVMRKRFRVDEFRKMVEAGILPEEHGWEVIDGFLMDKMSIGDKHASTVKRLNRIFNQRFNEGLLVSVQDPIQLDDYNAPEPDIALLRFREDFYLGQTPMPTDILLLIEVSDSTIEYDREIKKKLYAEAEIVEFWIVNLQENILETFSQPKNGSYRSARILEAGEVIKSNTVNDLELTVNEILGL